MNKNDKGDLTYSTYLGCHKEAVAWQYSEVDKSDRNKAVINVLILVGMVVIICSGFDSYRLCVAAMCSAVLSLITLDAGSFVSQYGFRFYRDELLESDMSVNQEAVGKYARITSCCEALNYASSFLCYAAMILVCVWGFSQ